MTFSLLLTKKSLFDLLFYPNKFSIVDFMVFGDQLDTYIIDLRNDDKFSDIEGIARLAEKMLKRKNNLIFSYIYMSLVVYIKKNIFNEIDNEVIMKRFQNIKTRREQL